MGSVKINVSRDKWSRILTQFYVFSILHFSDHRSRENDRIIYIYI